ncbi:MAG: CAP domain-containing protein [Hyphomicrobiales bacterium]
MRRVVFAAVLLAGACSSLGVLGMQFAQDTAVAAPPAPNGSAESRGALAAGLDLGEPVTDSTPATATETPEATATSQPGVNALPDGLASSTTPVTASAAKAEELLRAMNAARVDEGLAALEWDETLADVAMTRAQNLIAGDYFDHYGPDGDSAFAELAARGVRYRLAGENLARNNYPETQTVDAAFAGLMASPGHRANILEPAFTRAGVAAVKSGGMWLYVTVFMN